MLHEGSEGEPQAVADGEVVGQLSFAAVHVPLLGAEATDQKQHHAHPDEGEHRAEPDFLQDTPGKQWIKGDSC